MTEVQVIDPGDGVLSDEQVENLLQQAEARLQSASTTLKRQQSLFTLPKNPKINVSQLPEPYVTTKSDVATADNARSLDCEERRRANGTRHVEDPVAQRKNRLLAKKATAGSQWFNLPKTELTPELKRDLQLIHMREVLDPHRHYKKTRGKMQVPEYSQVGTMQEGPTDFYSARLKNADRKRTLVEQVLAGEKQSGKFKSKYDAIQERKKSGKKGYYKALMRKKYGDRAKD